MVRSYHLAADLWLAPDNRLRSVSRAVRDRAGVRPDDGRPSPISHRMFVENLVLNHLQTT
ncbi:hypothetical protein NQZ68_040711 [Dissostichus eleginoides]|nr:hypothetical protein NQZ68_040711 [Dissostichus eleginoides]